MNCSHCNKLIRDIEFSPFCSRKCDILYNKILHTCKECNREFTPKNYNNIFCSKPCMFSWHKKSNPYANWTICTFKIFARDNFRCVYCGKSSLNGEKLHMDHIYPLNKGGQNDVFNLVTACQNCNLDKSNFLMPENLIIELWERNKKLDIESGLIKEYHELKRLFDRLNRHNESSLVVP